eukprot:9450999-Alexandrium_andersonii.AAC.1
MPSGSATRPTTPTAMLAKLPWLLELPLQRCGRLSSQRAFSMCGAPQLRLGKQSWHMEVVFVACAFQGHDLEQ